MLKFTTIALLLPLANTQSFPPQNQRNQQPQTQQNNPGIQTGNQQAPPGNQGGQQAAPVAQPDQATCRQRVSWTTMTTAAKNAFVNRLLEVKASGEYDLLTKKHMDEAKSTHGVSMFLPYHRWLLHSLEITMGMAIPYWDWSADSQAPHLADVFSNDYFGGNGVSGNCVESGKFTVSNGWASTVGTTGCLQRCFDGGDTIQAFSPPEFSAAFTSTSQTYEQFRNSIEGSVHAQLHNALGKRCSGDMAQMYSPNDPLFWLHHANVDRLYYRWQRSCKAYGSTFPGQTNSYPTDLNDLIFGTQFILADAMPDGRLCHNYAQAPSDIALQPNCPPDPANVTDHPTATGNIAPVPTPPASPLANVNLNDPASGWFVNQIRFLVPQGTTSGSQRRLLVNAGSLQLQVDDTMVITENATEVHLVARSTGGLNFNLANFQSIFQPTDFFSSPFIFQTESDSMVTAPDLTDLSDTRRVRYPPRLDEGWCEMMNLDVGFVRSLEGYEYNLIDEMNQMEGYESTGCLEKQLHGI